MSIAWRSFDILFCLMYVCVCVCHILYVSWCSWSMSTHGYICEHRECNVIPFCVLSLSPCVFHPESFSFGCSLLYLSPPPSSFFFSFPHFIHCLCPVLSSSYLYFTLVLFLSFLPSSSTIFLPPPAGCGHRKLVDCPQLLDVDDMVKMREPDWKCVYTYLQEFYRGLVTKGLVKTKNSS